LVCFKTLVWKQGWFSGAGRVSSINDLADKSRVIKLKLILK